jgi:hypothetical protein
MFTCYVFITWQKERLTSVINSHNILKSDTVDDCSHYMQYADKGDKIGNTNCISQCYMGVNKIIVFLSYQHQF